MNGIILHATLVTVPVPASAGLEPLSSQQAADVADHLRAARQGDAVDLLMGRLGLRQVVLLRQGTNQ